MTVRSTTTVLNRGPTTVQIGGTLPIGKDCRIVIASFIGLYAGFWSFPPVICEEFCCEPAEIGDKLMELTAQKPFWSPHSTLNLVQGLSGLKIQEF